MILGHDYLLFDAEVAHKHMVDACLLILYAPNFRIPPIRIQHQIADAANADEVRIYHHLGEIWQRLQFHLRGETRGICELLGCAHFHGIVMQVGTLAKLLVVGEQMCIGITLAAKLHYIVLRNNGSQKDE